MIKLLTILFLLYSIKILFSNNKLLRNSVYNYMNKLKEVIIENNSTDMTDKGDLLLMESISMIAMVIFSYFLMTIEFIYLMFVMKYDPLKYVVIVYIFYFIITFILGKIYGKSKILSNIKKYSVDEVVEEIDKFIDKLKKAESINRLSILLETTFFGYMTYILFIL